ncbi:MAG TPA: hypothetical protein DCS88_08775, partial [Alphaproteobacteria bacterium]|nr:hypothetical protein [Alphaproteobacteria bacterium]
LVLVLLTELAGLEGLEFHGADRLRREGVLWGRSRANWLERVCRAICLMVFSALNIVCTYTGTGLID